MDVAERQEIIDLSSGKELRVQVPAPGAMKSFFVFGLAKAGSTLLFDIFKRINADRAVPEISIQNDAFAQGIQPRHYESDPRMSQLLFEKGYCYSGFRRFFPFLTEFFETEPRSMLLVRDPRDVLTSLFFSAAYSHGIPGGSLGNEFRSQRRAALDAGIDQFVLGHAPTTLGVYESYLPLLPMRNFALFRYEDVIFEKPRWIHQMVEFTGEKLSKDRILEIASEFNVQPSREDRYAHIRRVTPGDHREKLQADTINQINDLFSPVMSAYGYET